MNATSACGQFCQNSDTNGPQGSGGAFTAGGIEKSPEIPIQGYIRTWNSIVSFFAALPQNTVSATVNFWAPGEGANKGKGPVGHLSVEFSNGVYVSAWPLGGTGAAGTLLDIPSEVDFRPSYESDKKSYGREADLRLKIGNLDAASVKSYWAFIQKNPGEWNNGRNCADIVAEAISYAGVRLNNTQVGISLPRETLYLIQRDARQYKREPWTAPIWKSNYHSVMDLRRVYD